MGKKLFFVFRIFIGLAILYAVFKFVPYQELWNIYKDSRKIYLLGAILIFLSSYLFGVWRWQYLLFSLGIKISFRESFYASFSGLFFNLFFPSFVAGDVFRSLTISHRHKERKKVASSVLMDRFSGAIALNLIAIVSFFFGRHLFVHREVFSSLCILSLVIGFMALVIFSRNFFHFATVIFKRKSKFRQNLIEFHNQLYFFKQNFGVFTNSMIFSLIIQGLSTVGFFVAAKAFGLKLGIIYFLVLTPIIMAITIIPITIAGIGTREASMVYFFSLVGVEKSISLGISILNLILILFTGILGGIIYVMVYHRWLQSHS